MPKKLKTPRRKSVTKPVRRYDTSGRTIGSGSKPRRTTGTLKGEPGRFDKVVSKTGKTYYKIKPEFSKYKKKGPGPRAHMYEKATVQSGPNKGKVYNKIKKEHRTIEASRRKTPVKAATTSKTSKTIAPRNIYTRGRSPAIAGTGTQRVTANRGGGFRGGFPPRDTTGGAVKQSTQAEIKAMQRRMDADRNANRLRTELNEFDRRFSNLKKKLAGIQGNPGLRGIFMGGGGSGKR